ncbi:MAG: MOSC domain-containing protein [Candidatus Mcinerneyibacterium aminivorans]|uniref:MOSC domain-containing protein n=1 Tax=Candidatus Mcinerneyibacterium aminivorans TaxID=2703815 RepID=A0A5D0MDJ1_9BACT|nr:MAG: MOSC domain-containing protein [Candidatus Mcinerneyibacterium aminivorans]
MKLLAICTSKKRGTFKYPQKEAILKKNWGIVGDAHADKWEKQVTILSQKSIEKFNKRYNINIEYGESAENLVVSNLDPANCPVGTKIEIGNGVLLEVTKIGKDITDDCPGFDKYGCCPTAEEGLFLKVVKGGKIKVEERVEII